VTTNKDSKKGRTVCIPDNGTLHRIYTEDGARIGYICLPDSFTTKEVNNLLRKGMKVTAVVSPANG